MSILQIKDLKTQFFTQDGVVRAVDGVSFDVGVGETLAIVGESGCGKSVTALSILRLIQKETGRIVEGSVLFDGRDLTKLSEEEMRSIRGHEISMIFQEPMTSLNPVLTIGTQIAENVVRHKGVSWQEARERAKEMLELVRIADPERRLDEYPHQMSGGMRQRVMIAIALSCDPKVLIADEPTTALDVTIQAQILDLMIELKEKIDAAIVMITHDLGVVADVADRVAVMYAGRIVETGGVEEVYDTPRHPPAPLHRRAHALHPDRRRGRDPARSDPGRAAVAGSDPARLRVPPPLPAGARPLSGAGTPAVRAVHRPGAGHR